MAVTIPTSPARNSHHSPSSIQATPMARPTTLNIAVTAKPRFISASGFGLSPGRTLRMPAIEASRPIAPITSEKRMYEGSPVAAGSAVKIAAPRIIAPMFSAAVDSKRSAPRPAQSPTLSPTRSAITAALRGSSSGMPASTLPTRSAPTSAAFV